MNATVLDLSAQLARALSEPEHSMPLEPGIYYDIPEAEYHRWPAASNSRLSVLANRSPAHYRANVDEPDDDDTDATAFGTALHFAVLQPELFAKRYAKGPAGNWAHKGPKDEVAALRAEGFDVLKPDAYENIIRARDAVYAHPDAAAFLRVVDAVEVSLLWHDPATGVLCKARTDAAAFRMGVAGDLKSTLDASPIGFARSCRKYGYHRQAAMNMAGAAVLGYPLNDFLFIAVEKAPPYAPTVYRMGEHSIASGRTELAQLLLKYRECEESGQWPAYGSGILDLEVIDRDNTTIATATEF